MQYNINESLNTSYSEPLKSRNTSMCVYKLYIIYNNAAFQHDGEMQWHNTIIRKIAAF